MPGRQKGGGCVCCSLQITLDIYPRLVTLHTIFWRLCLESQGQHHTAQMHVCRAGRKIFKKAWFENWDPIKNLQFSLFLKLKAPSVSASAGPHQAGSKCLSQWYFCVWPTPSQVLGKWLEKKPKVSYLQSTPCTLNGLSREMPHYPSFRITGYESKIKLCIKQHMLKVRLRRHVLSAVLSQNTIRSRYTLMLMDFGSGPLLLFLAPLGSVMQHHLTNLTM